MPDFADECAFALKAAAIAAKQRSDDFTVTMIAAIIRQHCRAKATVCRRNAPASDETFLRSLEADPTYTGINIRRELGKCQRWAQANRKQASQQRFVNWLNNAEPSAPVPAAHVNGSDPTNGYTKF